MDLQTSHICTAQTPGSCPCLFFSLHVNYLPLHLYSAEIIMYAGDKCTVFTAENLTELEAKANIELGRIAGWFLANKPTVNTRKTKYAMFHCPQKMKKKKKTCTEIIIDY